MAVIDTYAHGQFCWIDLLSHDMAQAKTFYSGLFSWDAVDQNTTGGPPYTLFTREGKHLCGLGEMSDEMRSAGVPSMWNSYINVDDLDATVAKVTELGGQIAMPAMQVMNAGRMAGIQDPDGATLFLWHPLEHKGAQLVNVPGTWVWNELMTPNPQAAMTFFKDLFGWTFERDENSPATYWVIENQGRKNGGLMEMTKEEFGDMPPCWVVYFSVEDMGTASGKLNELGGQLMHGPFESSVGPIAIAADNQGAACNLIQLTVPPDE